MDGKWRGAWRRVLSAAAIMTAFALAQSAGSALAAPAAQVAKVGGNIWLTGHDYDFHCTFGGQQCHALRIATDFVRSSLPALPVLVLDHGAEVQSALNAAYGGTVPFGVTVLDPRTQFAGATLFTNGVTRYSAIIVASDITCGGCDNNIGTGSTPDSDAINARSADIASMANQGTGLLGLAGARNIANFYNFVPVPALGQPVRAPFTFTPYGLSLGLLEGPDDNCCPTHNSFSLPAMSSPYKVVETDSAGLAETLVARSVVIGPNGIGLTGHTGTGNVTATCTSPPTSQLASCGNVPSGCAIFTTATAATVAPACRQSITLHAVCLGSSFSILTGIAQLGSAAGQFTIAGLKACSLAPLGPPTIAAPVCAILGCYGATMTITGTGTLFGPTGVSLNVPFSLTMFDSDPYPFIPFVRDTVSLSIFPVGRAYTASWSCLASLATYNPGCKIDTSISS